MSREGRVGLMSVLEWHGLGRKGPWWGRFLPEGGVCPEEVVKACILLPLARSLQQLLTDRLEPLPCLVEINKEHPVRIIGASKTWC